MLKVLLNQLNLALPSPTNLRIHPIQLSLCQLDLEVLLGSTVVPVVDSVVVGSVVVRSGLVPVWVVLGRVGFGGEDCFGFGGDGIPEDDEEDGGYAEGPEEGGVEGWPLQKDTGDSYSHWSLLAGLFAS